MYSNAAAVQRPDINTFVDEAGQNPGLFIAEQVLPVFESDTKAGVYPKFTDALTDSRKDDVKKRSPGSTYPRVNRAFAFDNFTCEDRGIEEPIDDSTVADLSRFFRVEVRAAMTCLNQARIRQELAVKDAIMNASTFRATAAAVAYTQSNIGTVDVPQDVFNAKDRGLANGKLFNGIVMSAQIYNLISRSTLLQNLVRGKRSTDSTVALSAAEIAQAFDLQYCLVGKAAYDTAKKGNQASTSFIWPNTYIWVGEIMAGEFELGGAGRIIQWKEDASSLYVTETYRQEEIRSDVVRVRQNVVEKISNTKAGELITTSYS